MSKRAYRRWPEGIVSVLRDNSTVIRDRERLRFRGKAWAHLYRRALAERSRRGSAAVDSPLLLGIEESAPSVAVARRERILRRSLAVADLAAVLLLSFALWTFGFHLPLKWFAVAVPGIILVSKIFGLYDRDSQLLIKSTLDEVPSLAQIGLMMLVLTLLALPATGIQLHVSLFIFAGYVVMSACLRGLARYTAQVRCGPERYVAVGNPSHVLRLAGRIRSSRARSELVGVIPHEKHEKLDRSSADALRRAQAGLHPSERFRSPRVPTDTAVTREDLTGYLCRRNAHRLLIVTRDSASGTTMDLIREAKALGIRVSLIASIFEVVEAAVEFEQIAGTTALGVRRFSLSRSSRRLKRGFDLLGSTLAVALLSPFLIVIALAIKLGSPGPALFSQVRVGRDGRRFRVFKFRTMVEDAETRKDDLRHLNEADGLFKIKADPRVTKIGKLLRRTSLDELPQLFNVVRGEMSLVGPRPLIEEEDERIHGWHRRRLHLTPGMTGPWQIMGSSKVPLHEMVQIDYLYVANWSLWADIKTLLRTVPYVITARSQ